jgi:hypothetical protein
VGSRRPVPSRRSRGSAHPNSLAACRARRALGIESREDQRHVLRELEVPAKHVFLERADVHDVHAVRVGLPALVGLDRRDVTRISTRLPRARGLPRSSEATSDPHPCIPVECNTQPAAQDRQGRTEAGSPTIVAADHSALSIPSCRLRRTTPAIRWLRVRSAARCASAHDISHLIVQHTGRRRAANTSSVERGGRRLRPWPLAVEMPCDAVEPVTQLYGSLGVEIAPQLAALEPRLPFGDHSDHSARARRPGPTATPAASCARASRAPHDVGARQPVEHHRDRPRARTSRRTPSSRWR